jgi:hypothetical protein
MTRCPQVSDGPGARPTARNYDEGVHRFTAAVYIATRTARAARITSAFDVRGNELMNQPTKANLKNPLTALPPEARLESRA